MEGERGQGSGWVAAHRGMREEPEAEVRGSGACVLRPVNLAATLHLGLQEGRRPRLTAVLTQLAGEGSGDQHFLKGSQGILFAQDSVCVTSTDFNFALELILPPGRADAQQGWGPSSPRLWARLQEMQ